MSNLDPEQAVYEVGIMEDRYEVWGSFEKLLNLLMVSFATVSLFLAALGLYGTLAFLVSERTREVGVRMSLGADRVSIFRMITAKGQFGSVTQCADHFIRQLEAHEMHGGGL